LAWINTMATGVREIRIFSPFDGKDQRLLPSRQTPCLERYPVFSPDGRWIAYATDESGRDEVYVQRYPGSGRQLVSSAGGVAPVWAPDGRELFYSVARPNGLEMMAVDVTIGSTFTAGRPHRLFEGPFPPRFPLRAYDVAPDGSRFLMVGLAKSPPTPPITQLVVVFNWHEELKQRVPSQ
jgi:eukaryotic-like serine/threonine-protein kinase